jgi:hypothetical protein
MTMSPIVTLLELIDAVSEFAATEGELLAAVVRLVNSGKVILGGTFRGCTFDIDELVPASVPSAA